MLLCRKGAFPSNVIIDINVCFLPETVWRISHDSPRRWSSVSPAPCRRSSPWVRPGWPPPISPRRTGWRRCRPRSHADLSRWPPPESPPSQASRLRPNSSCWPQRSAAETHTQRHTHTHTCHTLQINYSTSQSFPHIDVMDYINGRPSIFGYTLLIQLAVTQQNHQ